MVTTVDREVSESIPITDLNRPPIWWVTVQLAALGFHTPLTLFAGGLRAHAEAASALVVGLLVTAAAMLLYGLLLRFTESGWKALGWSSVTVIFFWHWGASVAIGPLPTWITSAALFALVLVAVGRYAHHRLFKLAFLACSVTLVGVLVLLTVRADAADNDAIVAMQSAPVSVQMTSLPDITLILLDGYGRADVIEQIYGYDNTPFEEELERSGFDVATLARSNYSITHLSIPSMLNMSYMHPDEASIGVRDLEQLAIDAGGANQTVRILKEHGYTYVHGDTVHGQTNCGPEVDTCLQAPWIDITMYSLLVNTPVGGLIYPTSGDPSTALNLMRIEQMRDWKAFKDDVSSGPTFTFLHLGLPHPPLYLDSGCNPRVLRELSGRVLNDGIIAAEILETRKDAWVEQVKCANLALLDLIAEAGEDEILIFTSDHGPDANFVLGLEAANLPPEWLAERLPTLTAVRLPQECKGSLPEDIDLVNIFREVFSCLSGQQLENIEGRYFVAGFAGDVYEFKDPND